MKEEEHDDKTRAEEQQDLYQEWADGGISKRDENEDEEGV